MKKSVEMLGLPIISITEGRELGISKLLLIDAQNGTVAALIIEDDDWYRGVKVLPYSSVIAIGDDAITITSSENILQLAEATEYEPLLTANVRIIDTKAITKAGSIQGSVSEIFIDDDGKIGKCSITTPSGDVKEITAEQVSIFGKQVTIIDSDVPERATSTTATTPTQQVAPQTKTEPAKEVVTPAAEKSADAPNKQVIDKATEERHRRFLLGKKASRRITTDNGIVIVEAGADITEEVLQKAKLANKFVELSMNIQ